MAALDSATALHTVTPLVRSARWSDRVGAEVFFKLDALQAPGSFKIRGIGRAVSQAAARGNAGLAAAYAAMRLGLKCTVVLPNYAPESVRHRLEQLYGATVVRHGDAVPETIAEAERLSAERGWPHIHPFQDEQIWAGHATVVAECVEQLAALGVEPDCFVTAVGGGGLLMGVLRGLDEARDRIDSDGVLVVAAETQGAHSYAHSLDAGAATPLPGGITSVAKSLGAVTPSPDAVALGLARGQGLRTLVVTDADALAATADFLDEMRILVEPACGAALAALAAEHRHVLAGRRCIVVEVCGGAVIDLETLVHDCANHGVPLKA